MPEFDIDQLKSAWQQPTEPKYGQAEILKMLNRKSRNYVKYIFWISAAEFLLFLMMGIWYAFGGNSDSSYFRILARIGIEATEKIRMDFEHLYFLMKVVSLLISGYFMVKFYLNYRKIRVEEDLKKLITKILRFRRTVKNFIIVNLVLVVLFVVVLAGFMFSSASSQNIELQNRELVIFYTVLLISTALGLGMAWLYYRLAYGILMKKLEKNLAQLREMDRE